MMRFVSVLAMGCLWLVPSTTTAQPARRFDLATIGQIAQATQPDVAIALLVKRYVVEAFVIPTGAMAPTLLGRHRVVVCPNCASCYPVNASEEVRSGIAGSLGEECEIVSGTCPMCGYTVSPGSKTRLRSFFDGFVGSDAISGGFRLTGGDRILASKLAYRLGEPQRWDVAVFQYPGDPRTNYVKRIVGLPRETVRIAHGDIFIRHEGDEDFRIARKPPEVARALLQPVYDNDYASAETIRKGWPPRWSAWPHESEVQAGGWAGSEDGKSFQTNGTAAGEVWVRYQHLVPSYEDWRRLKQGSLPKDFQARPQLIADSYAYNTGMSRRDLRRDPSPDPECLHWVGDLALEATLEARGPAGEVVFELVEGGRPLRCRIDVRTGEARLSIAGLDVFRPVAATDVRGPGTHKVLFANVDDQLLLWIDDVPVQFNVPTTCQPLGNTRPRPADLAPAGIASRGAALRVSHLKVSRDVYYIALRGREPDYSPCLSDFDARATPYRPFTRQRIAEFLSSPGEWDAFEKTRNVEFQLAAGQYLVLGDNSPRSKDSRLWEMEGAPYYVRRDQFLGKVLGRYFPSVGIVR